MKFLRVGDSHQKNKKGFILLAKHCNAIIIESDDRNIWKEKYDLVWVPCGFYPSSNFPNAKRILYGPSNFVFPKEPWTTTEIRFTNSIYTCLSDWNKKVYDQFNMTCMPIKPIPFPVDTELFKPQLNSSKKNSFFVYFKHRDWDLKPELLNLVTLLSNKYNLHAHFIEYGKYNEEDYINILQTVDFGIWVGSHESQGFAFEEALSMNIPLVVFDVQKLQDEYNHLNQPSYMEYSNKYNLSATTCSYWDDRCGLRCFTIDELYTQANKMVGIHSVFRPREFILDTMNAEKCWKRICDYFDLK